jgi:hypothetical protein
VRAGATAGRVTVPAAVAPGRTCGAAAVAPTLRVSLHQMRYQAR